MPTLSSARRRVTLATKGTPLPDCWAQATVAAAALAFERDTESAKASRRRLLAKVDAIQAVSL